MTPYRVLTALLSLLVAAALLALGIAIVAQDQFSMAIDAVGFITVLAVLIAHLRRWRWSAHATIVLVTLIVVASVPDDARQRVGYLYNALIPAILALVLLPWYWSAGSFLVGFVGILATIGLSSVSNDPGLIVVLFVMAGGCSLASVVARSALLRAEANAHRAEEALGNVERQAHELADANELMTEQLDQQRRLLDLVTTLETPVVALADGVLLAPVVGALDSRRAQWLTSRLLEPVSQQRARLIVLDIAGMTSVDTSVARALLDATQAVRLLGCDVILSGISAAVATTLTHLNINLEEIRTARSPQDALQQYGGWTSATTNGVQRAPYHYGTN
jgi:anti-anti-sigma regulatory factor